MNRSFLILLWYCGYSSIWYFAMDIWIFYIILINITLDDCATIFLMSCSWQSKEYWTAGKRIQVHDGSTLYTQPLGNISQFYGCTGERSCQEGCWWKELTEATHHPSDCCHMLSHEWMGMDTVKSHKSSMMLYLRLSKSKSPKVQPQTVLLILTSPPRYPKNDDPQELECKSLIFRRKSFVGIQRDSTNQ